MEFKKIKNIAAWNWIPVVRCNELTPRNLEFVLGVLRVLGEEQTVFIFQGQFEITCHSVRVDSSQNLFSSGMHLSLISALISGSFIFANWESMGVQLPTAKAWILKVVAGNCLHANHLDHLPTANSPWQDRAPDLAKVSK